MSNIDWISNAGLRGKSPSDDAGKSELSRCSLLSVPQHVDDKYVFQDNNEIIGNIQTINTLDCERTDVKSI